MRDLFFFLQSDEFRVNVQFLFLFLFQWPPILGCFIPPNSIWLSSNSPYLALCCWRRFAAMYPQINPAPNKPLCEGHLLICHWKNAYILAKIISSMLYFHKSPTPAHDSILCPPSSPPVILMPRVCLPRLHSQILSLLHFPLSSVLNPYFPHLARSLRANGKVGDSLNVYVRKPAPGSVSWWSCHSKRKWDNSSI